MTAALRQPDRDVWTVDDLAGLSGTFGTDRPWPVRLDLPALAARYERLLAPSRSAAPR